MRRLATLALASALKVLALASFTFTSTDAAGDSFADGPGTAVAHEAATDDVTQEATDAVPAGESLYEGLMEFVPDTRAVAHVESEAVAGAWSAIGKPWPNWAPCDSAAVFADVCAPRRAARTEVVVPVFCNHAQGLGKNLFKYSVEAAARFRNGTGVVFDEAYGCVESQPIQDTFNLSVPERIFEGSLSSRRELGERIRTVQESWETSSI